MWDLIVSVPDHCLSFYFSTDRYKVVVMMFSICMVYPLTFSIRVGRHFIYCDFQNKAVVRSVRYFTVTSSILIDRLK